MNKESLKKLPLLVYSLDENLAININDFIDHILFKDFKLSYYNIQDVAKKSKKFHFDTKSKLIKCKEKPDRNVVIFKMINIPDNMKISPSPDKSPHNSFERNKNLHITSEKYKYINEENKNIKNESEEGDIYIELFNFLNMEKSDNNNNMKNNFECNDGILSEKNEPENQNRLNQIIENMKEMIEYILKENEKNLIIGFKKFELISENNSLHVIFNNEEYASQFESVIKQKYIDKKIYKISTHEENNKNLLLLSLFDIFLAGESFKRRLLAQINTQMPIEEQISYIKEILDDSYQRRGKNDDLNLYSFNTPQKDIKHNENQSIYLNNEKQPSYIIDNNNNHDAIINIDSSFQSYNNYNNTNNCNSNGNKILSFQNKFSNSEKNIKHSSLQNFNLNDFSNLENIGSQEFYYNKNMNMNKDAYNFNKNFFRNFDEVLKRKGQVKDNRNFKYLNLNPFVNINDQRNSTYSENLKNTNIYGTIKNDSENFNNNNDMRPFQNIQMNSDDIKLNNFDNINFHNLMKNNNNNFSKSNKKIEGSNLILNQSNNFKIDDSNHIKYPDPSNLHYIGIKDLSKIKWNKNSNNNNSVNTANKSEVYAVYPMGNLNINFNNFENLEKKFKRVNSSTIEFDKTYHKNNDYIIDNDCLIRYSKSNNNIENDLYSLNNEEINQESFLLEKGSNDRNSESSVRQSLLNYFEALGRKISFIDNIPNDGCNTNLLSNNQNSENRSSNYNLLFPNQTQTPDENSQCNNIYYNNIDDNSSSFTEENFRSLIQENTYLESYINSNDTTNINNFINNYNINNYINQSRRRNSSNTETSNKSLYKIFFQLSSFSTKESRFLKNFKPLENQRVNNHDINNSISQISEKTEALNSNIFENIKRSFANYDTDCILEARKSSSFYFYLENNKRLSNNSGNYKNFSGLNFFSRSSINPFNNESSLLNKENKEDINYTKINYFYGLNKIVSTYKSMSKSVFKEVPNKFKILKNDIKKNIINENSKPTLEILNFEKSHPSKTRSNTLRISSLNSGGYSNKYNTNILDVHKKNSILFNENSDYLLKNEIPSMEAKLIMSDISSDSTQQKFINNGDYSGMVNDKYNNYHLSIEP